MTGITTIPVCAICGKEGVAPTESPRRTIVRGADARDGSHSVIALLPEVILCPEHCEDFRRRDFSLGWCDNRRCRIYGESGATSPCGKPYKELRR